MLNHHLTRQELVSQLAIRSGLNELSVNAVLNELAGLVAEQVKLNSGCVLPGIGFFEARKSPERTAKNPRTGEPVKIPARTNLIFEFGSRFKQGVMSTWETPEKMLTTKLWKAPTSILEALVQKGAAAEEWNTLDPKGYPLDNQFIGFLEKYEDVFAYALKPEGQIDPERLSGLTAGYITAETLKERLSDLRTLDLATLKASGTVQIEAMQSFAEHLHRLREFMNTAATQNMGLVVLTFI